MAQTAVHDRLQMLQPVLRRDVRGHVLREGHLLARLGAEGVDLAGAWVDLHDIDAFEEVREEGQGPAVDQIGDDVIRAAEDIDQLLVGDEVKPGEEDALLLQELGKAELDLVGILVELLELVQEVVAMGYLVDLRA